MHGAISNTSPLVYLHRVGGLAWLGELFSKVWVPSAVVAELAEGKRRGWEVPVPAELPFLEVVNPKALPSDWLSLDLGGGELAAMALALENPGLVVLLDDGLARRTAQAAGLEVWGTLRVLLEAKRSGIVDSVSPWIASLEGAGLWITASLGERIKALAGEE